MSGRYVNKKKTTSKNGKTQRCYVNYFYFLFSHSKNILKKNFKNLDRILENYSDISMLKIIFVHNK